MITIKNRHTGEEFSGRSIQSTVRRVWGRGAEAIKSNENPWQWMVVEPQSALDRRRGLNGQVVLAELYVDPRQEGLPL